MVKYHREKGLNVFTFQVDDPDIAMDALLNTPKLVTLGNVNVQQLPRPTTSSTRKFENFILCGLPSTDVPGTLVPTLVGGSPGTVGAVYTYSFFAGVNDKYTVRVHTELAEVVDERDVKRVVYRHQNECNGNITVSPCCLDSPELPRKNTKSRFELTQSGTSWSVRFSFTGPSASNAIEREGICNYIWCNSAVMLCFLPCLPCYLCVMCTSDFHVRNPLLKLVGRVQEYCNGNGDDTMESQTGQASVETTVVKREGPLRAKRDEEEGPPESIQEAIPLAQISGENTRAKELKRWFDLYKSGAISKSEYDVEKAKLLHDP